MPSPLVLNALVRAGRGEALSVATSDPILAGIAKRRVARVIEQAKRATNDDDKAHVARLAYLFATDAAPDGSFDDRSLVQGAFDRAAARGGAVAERRGRPWLTGAVVGSLVAAGLGGAVVAWRARPFDPHREAVGRVLDGIEQDVIALSHDPNATLSRGSVSTRALKKAVGDEGVAAFDDLRARLKDVANAGGESAETTDATNRFYGALGSANVALARAHQPFFLDADIKGRDAERSLPIVYSFYVEREDQVTPAGGSPIRVVFLWRYDELNVGQAFLGYTHPRAGAAMVLLDQVEEELITLILPTLKEGEPLALIDAKTAETKAPWQTTLGARAGEVVRAYFAGDADGAALRHIGELLVKRRQIVATWKGELPLVGMRLVPPTRLIPEVNYADELRHRVGKESLEAWDDVHDELLRPANVEVFERLRDRLAKSTERHEVQHRIDYGRGLVAAPPLLAERLGLESTLDLLPGTYPARCRDETSAYLAQMADPGDSPMLTLVSLSRFLFDRGHWGSPYSCAAQMVIEMVGRELGVAGGDESLVAGGSVRREALAGRFAEIVEKGDKEVRGAAGRAWGDAFGGEVGAVTVEEVRRGTRWRH